MQQDEHKSPFLIRPRDTDDERCDWDHDEFMNNLLDQRTEAERIKGE